MSGDFDWTDKESITIGEQLAVAVYENPRGDIVIRQQDWYGDEDDWVIVAKQNVPALCRALFAAAGIDAQTTTVTLLPARSSGAERQKRYRQRHAPGDGCDGDVTPRDGGVTRRDAERDGRDSDLLFAPEVAAE